MDCIVPSRSLISDRFPVASFMVRVPKRRYYEVACATDPRLFHTGYAGRRTAENFYSSRVEGLLPAEDADATYFIPPDQLRRFAGASRIYYALGSYAGRNGEDARFSISPDTVERAPCISLASDFTGRSLDRRRVGFMSAPVAYGAPATGPLRWGGDALLEAEQAETAVEPATATGYDDGYGPGLWDDDARRAAETDRAVASAYANDAEVGVGEEEAPHTPGETIGGAADDVTEDEPGMFALSSGVAADGGQDPADEEIPPDARPHGLDESSPAGDDIDIAAGYEDGGAADTREAGGGADDIAEGLDEGDYQEEVAEAAGYDDDGELYGAVRCGSVAGETAGETLAPIRHDKAAGYDDDGPAEESLPVGPASRPLGGTPLDIAEKVRLARLVGRAEGGDDGYRAVSADRAARPVEERLGLSFGFLLFPQRSGALGRVLRKAREREEQRMPPEGQRLSDLFGPATAQLLATTDPQRTPDPEARLAPVEGKRLWEEPWLSRFRAAGAVPHVQAAQNEVAVADVFDRMLPLGRGLGLDTPRALALLLDRAADMGVGTARAWVMSVVGPVRSEADRDAALAALGIHDLRAFQQQARDTEKDGRWGPLTHAALAGALRALGSRSPVAVLPRQQMVTALLDAARGTSFEARMRALGANRTDLDDNQAYELL